MRIVRKGIQWVVSVILVMAAALLFTFTFTEDKIQATEAEQFTGASIPAFPGAEGGGAYTSGGRGGDVYIVTNLLDYSENENPVEGSLRYGILSTPPEGRTIVFNVSGTVELVRSLRFDNIRNLTIAGQTAPGNGITIAGWDTNISNSENIIIRYIAFRPGAINVYNGSDSMDALWGRDNNYFILDHCSFSWNTDETLSTYRGENGTIQWCIVSESLTLSGHSKGRHGYGGIIGGDKVTAHHNLYVSHTSRNPRLGGGYAGKADADHVAVVQFSNNVIYNWGFNTCYGGGFTFTNFVNNLGIAGPGTRDNVRDLVINPGESGKLGGFYIYGNRINGDLTTLLDASSRYVKNSGDDKGANATAYGKEPFLSSDSMGTASGISNKAFDDYIRNSIVAADSKLLDDILKQAGATYPRRDAIDARIVAEVKNGLGRYINTEHEVGGYISPLGVIEANHPDDYDTNANGIADLWEKGKGIFEDDDAYRRVTSSGYTWLELFLNDLVDFEHEAENPVARIVSPDNNSQYTYGNAVAVGVEAYSDYGYGIAKVAIYNGSKYLGDAVPKDGRYIFTIDRLKDGSYFISARATDSKGNATQTTAIEVHVNESDSSLSDTGWISTDIGMPDIKGSASMVNGILTVKGNGKLGASEGSIASSKEGDATKDDAHFVYRKLTGDMEITAKLRSIGSVDNHAFTGIMVRENLAENSVAAVLGLSWVKISNAYCWSAYLAGRNVMGGDFDNLMENLDSASTAEKSGVNLIADIPFKVNGIEQGYWLKLGRKGDTFYAYGSLDGDEWTLIGERTIAMKDSVYVGFAVDSNDVANDIEQLNYAKFSDIEIGSSFSPIGEEEKPIGPVEKVDLSVIDHDGFLNVTMDGNTMLLEQSATEGQMTKSTASLADNVSYLVFPKSSRNATMEMDITIVRAATDSSNMGLFVGAFCIGDNEELYNSLGFRNAASQNLTGYWSKLGKEGFAAGNGSSTTNNGSSNTKPSYILNEPYHVKFEKTDTGYTVYYTGLDELGNPLDAYKVFKATEAVLSSPEYMDRETQFGFALIGVSARIENLTLMDEYGNFLYSPIEAASGAKEETEASPSDEAQDTKPKEADDTKPGEAEEIPSVHTEEDKDEPSKESDNTKYEIYIVKKGDNLWRIAKEYYSDGSRYRLIYEANRDRISDPNAIYIGQELILP